MFVKFASLSYRHDGSSRFAKENRWGDFWSFGAGWRISEEAFMKDVKWVNNLKLRASYGETGNDNILDSDGDPDYYPYLFHRKKHVISSYSPISHPS